MEGLERLARFERFERLLGRTPRINLNLSNLFNLLNLSVLLILSYPRPLRAQRPDTALERSQQRLLEIRREREQLLRDMERLRGRVHSLSSELVNIERQVDISGRIVNELELQVATMGSQIERVTSDLIVAEDALAEKRAILHHRLSEIHKRGPLYAVQVLVAAESFGDLLSRYKYLYLISRQDRQLVRDVEELRDRVKEQRNGLLALQSRVARSREERLEEIERLRELESQRQRSLQESQRDARRMEQRLAQLARDEQRLNNLIAALERRRLAAEAARNAPRAPARIRTSDIGQLDWPVAGDILYRFGRQAGPGNTTLRWNGIGIAAPVGSPVRAVSQGTVERAERFGTYGLCVVLDHGGGFYSLYCQLEQATVRRGQGVSRGEVIGTSGGANSDEGPHLHFEIRSPSGPGGQPQAVDPITWLRRRQ